MLNKDVGTSLTFATKGMSLSLQKAIAQLVPAKELLLTYYEGRAKYRTNDIVLVVAADDPETISFLPRSQYLNNALKNDAARKMRQIAHESAYEVAKLPIDSKLSAFWLVFEVRGYPEPIMCVLSETFYETGEDVEAPSIRAN